MKNTNQRDLIITMTDDFIGIIKDTDPVTIDIEDIDERQEMFDLLDFLSLIMNNIFLVFRLYLLY